MTKNETIKELSKRVVELEMTAETLSSKLSNNYDQIRNLQRTIDRKDTEIAVTREKNSNLLEVISVLGRASRLPNSDPRNFGSMGIVEKASPSFPFLPEIPAGKTLLKQQQEQKTKQQIKLSRRKK